MSPLPSPPEDNSIEEELSYPILLSERLRKAVTRAVFFTAECSQVGRQADRLSTMLRSAIRLSAGSQIYERPLRRISADVSRNLHRALYHVQRCRRRSFLLRVVRIVASVDFRKVISLLEASISDVVWLLSILECRGINLALPPITSNDPIVGWVWSFTAALQMGQISDRIEAANELASLAEDNDRNKKIIVQEAAVPVLLKLLKETSCPEAQIAAATVLCSVANDRERVRVIVDHLGVPLIVQVLNVSTMRVQARVSNLVAAMAEHNVDAKVEFARENVIRPLVSLLSFETFEGDLDCKRYSFHSIVQIIKEREKEKEKNHHHPQLSSSLSFSSLYSEGFSSRGVQSRKERESERPELKREVKINCSRALWMLAKDCLPNSSRISETKGLLCLAKLIEKEREELQRNCLMAVMVITLIAELNPDLRRSAFKTNSPAAKAVVEQLLTVINEVDDPGLQVAAVRSIGALSRTFPAKEIQVIVGPLVGQLKNKDIDVATEAAIALAKFASPENFLSKEHSRVIIESDGVGLLMRLVRAKERAQAHGLILLCHLATSTSSHRNLEKAGVLTAFQGAEQTVQQPHLRELIRKAIYHLNVYRGDIHPLRQHAQRKSK